MRKHRFIVPTMLVVAILAACLAATGEQSLRAAENKTLRVLFIGNSFTGRHNLSQVVKAMAEAGNPHLRFDVTKVIYGGRTLKDHWRLGTQNFVRISTLTAEEEQATIKALEETLAKNPKDVHAKAALGRHRELIQSLDSRRKKWDIVVLQSYRDDLEGDKSLYVQYAPKFAELIKAQGERVVLYETTPTTQNDKPLSAPPDTAPVIEKARTIAALARRIDATVVPMSMVALHCQTIRPDLTLRFVNDGHLNQTMAYLTACTFYAALFDRSPEGLAIDTVTDTRSLDNDHKDKDRDGGPIARTFSAKDRSELQRIAWEGLNQFKQPATDPSGSQRWEKAIQAFEAADKNNPPSPGAILFIGSSTIVRWKTLAGDFPEDKVINRGFGGSQVADSVFYADRIVTPYKPRLIVLRAGGNDIHAGKTPEQVLADFKAFVEKVQAKLPETRIAYMTINATPSRWANVEWEKKANELIKDYVASGRNLDYIDTCDATLGPDGKPREELFVKDRLHFNEEGYRVLVPNPTGIWGRKGAHLQNGFSCYSSRNLVDWKYEGVCFTFPKDGWLATATSHRPNVLYNDKTGKYIAAGSGVQGWNPTDTSYAVANAPLGPYREMGLMSEQRTWNSRISNFVYIVDSDKIFAMCDQWFLGPKGERVPIDQSCQLWLPVSFDPATGAAKMLHVQQWDPWK